MPAFLNDILGVKPLFKDKEFDANWLIKEFKKIAMHAKKLTNFCR